MSAVPLHRWDLTPEEAVEAQNRLRQQVRRETDFGPVRLVAGVDVAFPLERCRAAMVILTYPQLEVVEVARAEREITFPYIPGLLAFRELPSILAAAQALAHGPDLVLVDGQGLAHPRHFGIACHLGLFLNKPTIGCAKSRLCGQHSPLGKEVASQSYLYDGQETVGAALRTKLGTNPLYVSIGHRIDLATAIDYVLHCCQGYRLPEPTRQAHLAANQ